MGYVLVLGRPICIRSTLSELFVVAILLTVAVNFAAFVTSCLFRITFPLTILFDLLCVLNWKIPRSSALVELTVPKVEFSKSSVNIVCVAKFCIINVISCIRHSVKNITPTTPSDLRRSRRTRQLSKIVEHQLRCRFFVEVTRRGRHVQGNLETLFSKTTQACRRPPRSVASFPHRGNQACTAPRFGITYSR